MKCADCGKEKKLMCFTESTLHYTHGISKMVCKECYIHTCKEKIRNIQRNIEQLSESAENE